MAAIAMKISFILLVLAITIPCLEGRIGEFDDYLKAQAEMARQIAFKSYVPNPENITTEINIHVHLAMEAAMKAEAQSNDTGKELMSQKSRGRGE
ncbi:pectate lyase, putative [Medicago truncatula]|uniref:Pectate lyase, N-terminal n=1 Tax=Medicago truncatula TaxID=3880 RepID=A2Q5R6_MEDTR|nr:Pectate lyase, N-terminal [Medicago truncatula]AES77377.1 pectate lyase, putative [Medicago truncatula]